jgi:hypothetical protein
MPSHVRCALLLFFAPACGLGMVGVGVAEEPIDASPAPSQSADAGDARNEEVAEVEAPRAPCDAADPSLLACFAFDGAAVDGSGQRVAPLVATGLTFVEGRSGMAARFARDPKADMRIPHEGFNTTQVTIETWFRITSLPPAGGRAMVLDMNGRFGVILGDDGIVRCRGLPSPLPVVVGEWTHVACAYDGESLSIYWNGELGGSVPDTLPTTSDWIGIGQDSPSTNDGLEGDLDELRVWSVARTSAEIVAAAGR